MTVSRRSFLKANAAAAAAAAAGLTLPVSVAQAAGEDKNVKWDKAPCRFCGTGCSVLVGTQNGRVVASQGGSGCAGEQRVELYQGLFPA